MNKPKSKIKRIERVQNWGLYVWKMPDGRFVGDNDGNIMNVPAMRGDIAAMTKLRKAATFYGAVEGMPVFLPGTRRVSDLEYSEQRERFANGMIPSETDYGAYYDAQQGLLKHGE